MNRQVRRIGVLVGVMVVALMVAATSIQFFQAASLNADTRNARTFYSTYNRDRGPIVVAGEAVASSQPVGDDFGYQRSYLNGPLYAPLTGYFSVVFRTSMLENTENDILAGTDSSLAWARIKQTVTGKQPRGGAVELSIDPALQQSAWDALGDAQGAAVVMDPKTGAIRAMVSKPSYDPNTLAGHDTDEVNAAWKQLIDDPTKPMSNRAIAGDQYFPGSTFKLVTAAAALESGNYSVDTQIPAPQTLELPNTRVSLPNYGDSSCSGTGTMAIKDALRISCNTAFGQLGMDLGQDALDEQAKKFGFDRKLSIPLAVTPSRVTDAEGDQAKLARAAIGQEDDRVTPLQMAMIVSSLVNDGHLMKPYLVANIRDSDLAVIQETKAQELSRAVSSKTATDLKAAMISVVDSGTGIQAAIPGVSVGGKTGTAETGRGFDDSWFAGFVETADGPVVIALVVEGGGTGADTAAGRAGTVLRTAVGK